MLKFDKNVNDRKELVKRLGELTGIQPVYMRTPTYAFRCGDYTVDRDGCLLVDEENADASILTALMSEGLIIGGEVLVGETQEEMPEELVETSTEETLQETDEPGNAEDATENAQAGEDEIDLDMGFPISAATHTGTSLRNLVNLIYSRGKLVNKATGGHFDVDEGLIEALKDDSCTYSATNFRKAVAEYERVHGTCIYGLNITPEEVTFTGFGKAADVEHLTAYGQLAILMNAQAINQKRVQAKIVDDTNEKYALRIWLMRIGMGGDEYKRSRKCLMENLGGHTAFRTMEDAEKAKVKSQKKRDALKATKLAMQVESCARVQRIEESPECPARGDTAVAVGDGVCAEEGKDNEMGE